MTKGSRHTAEAIEKVRLAKIGRKVNLTPDGRERKSVQSSAWIESHREKMEYIWSLTRGPRHWNWKGGITPAKRIDRNRKELSRWRRGILRRDARTCQVCGCKDGQLHAHHILAFAYWPELRFSLNNGVTLCVACHREAHLFDLRKAG